ncbi:family 88 putative glycosyl hydrolase [Phaeosphaeriaceae sp. PMI808]|nr:family 88 putative glycosyl hydrolase [Phaeosphaeriaceae sp. PMI808]
MCGFFVCFVASLAAVTTCVSAKAVAQSAGTASHPYSSWMLDSILSRGEGIRAADGLLSSIQKGIFQEALRAAVEWSDDEGQNKKWLDYHYESIKYNVAEFLDPHTDSLAPLDRLCAGRSLMKLDHDERTALIALRKSIDIQLRNDNGGYWYFVDPPEPYEQYGNLSYSDGMYGFAPFAVLYGLVYEDPHLNIVHALDQLEIMYQHTLHQDTGLIVHGYDGSKAAPWADSETGASPIVWGRSLAWYTMGLVDALAMAATSEELTKTKAYQRMRDIFENLATAEIQAIRKSAKETGRYGVWQVFDQPGKEGNFVEASATAMLVYALAKGLRYGYIREERSAWGYFHQQSQTPLSEDDESIEDVLRATYKDLTGNFVEEQANGTLNFEKTGVLSSLHVASPSYDYYVSRDVTENSLIGTSAFVLASLEIEHLGEGNVKSVVGW